MGLINAGPFIGAVSAYRSVHITGRWGGHKTSLAFYIAQIWLKKGYRLVTNCRSAWADDYENLSFVDKDGHLKVVVIMDEGGLHLDTNREVKEYTNFAAKMDIIYLYPSASDVPRDAAKVICQVLFSFSKIGIPLIVYKYWVLTKGFKDEGVFLWFNPKEVYGVYSRQDPGAYTDDIVDWLIEKTQAYRTLYGRTARKERKAAQKQVRSVANREADVFKDAAEQFADSIEALSVHQRGRGRRRS